MAINTYQDTLGRLYKEKDQMSTTVQDLLTRIQVIEQHSRYNNIEIQCVPEHKQENLVSTVMQISKVISCNLNETDIHHCTRVAKSNREDKRPRAIVVKFATPRLRDTFLAKTIKFNKANPKDKINSSHIGIGGNKTPIFILEHLSPINKKLHATARQMAKEKGFKFVWIKQGRVFMRKSETDQSIYVKNLDTLKNII
ncbi:uncharacterized protein LOC142985913 [Anticarsia gemmatalis]|uniref:uncharacterized protein LOC142985913 n=1 Tax=Anticarsia gemmatalis TaxID=129554 RepID=UPI003F76D567